MAASPHREPRREDLWRGTERIGTRRAMDLFKVGKLLKVEALAWGGAVAVAPLALGARTWITEGGAAQLSPSEALAVLMLSLITLAALVVTAATQVGCALNLPSLLRAPFVKGLGCWAGAIVCRVMQIQAGGSWRHIAMALAGFYLYFLTQAHFLLADANSEGELANDFQKHWSHHRITVFGLVLAGILIGSLQLPPDTAETATKLLIGICLLYTSPSPRD